MGNFDRISFGKRLKKCREQLGLTQLEIASGSHINKTGISALEVGNSSPSYGVITKIITFYKENWEGDDKNLLLLLDMAKTYTEMYRKNIFLNVTSLPILTLEKRTIGDECIYLFNKTLETHEVTNPVLRNEEAVNSIVYYNEVNNYRYIKVKEDNILRGVPKEALLLVEDFDIDSADDVKGTFLIKLNENDYDMCKIHSKESTTKESIIDYEVVFKDADKTFIENTITSGIYKRHQKYDQLFVSKEENNKSVFTIKYRVLTIINYVDED